MAIASIEEASMFIEHNRDCDGLLEWIIDLLPQATFEGYIADIREAKGMRDDCEECEDIGGVCFECAYQTTPEQRKRVDKAFKETMR